MSNPYRLNQKESEFASCALCSVAEFMYTFAQPVPIGWQNAEVRLFPLRERLITEEFTEFIDAKSKLEQLDAVCEMLYVALGGLITAGFRYPELEANGFVRPLPKAMGEVRRQFLAQPCKAGILDKVSSACVTLVRLGRTMFGPEKFEGAFHAVHMNNMMKLWTEEEVHACTEAITVAEVRPLAEFPERKYRVSNKLGKIIKPPGHQKVDLTPYV